MAVKKNLKKEKQARREMAMQKRRIGSRTSKKLIGLFLAVVAALIGLAIRITYINATEGKNYERIVMTQAQQQYDSRTIPFQRGDITDRNGTVLATSKKVYNLVLDCFVVNSEIENAEGGSDQFFVEPTIKALVELFGLNEAEIRSILTAEETKNSQYYILANGLSITEKKKFEAYVDLDSEENKNLSDEEWLERSYVKGIWFEETYERTYPYESLACDLIGFTYDGTTADWGIEGYYSGILNGSNGRQYGYFNDDSDVEQNIIPAKNGYNVVSTIDINVQQIIRDALEIFEAEMADDTNKTNGAMNIGVVVMDPNTGEILGMDSDRWYDLNEPRDLTRFYTRSEIKAMSNDEMMDALNGIWGNFCISSGFEPGSVFKPITAAAALSTGAITTDTEFVCDGGQQVADKYIACEGVHGTSSFNDVIQNSCNDALMQIGEALGDEAFLKYNNTFNFGLRTGIDLPGEASGLLFTSDTMGPVELATCAFGQGFTCTMLQETAAISSVINGGYYYKPHVVREITDENGAVIQSFDPILERRTVSAEVSADIRASMAYVMTRDGTGYLAKIPGYSMGGKTGTAEKLPRGYNNYVLSFVSFAPLDNPKVCVYVVVDEPNTAAQETTIYAMSISRNIYIELLPYLGILPDEPGYNSSNVTNTLCTNGMLLTRSYVTYDNGIEVTNLGNNGAVSYHNNDTVIQSEEGTESTDPFSEFYEGDGTGGEGTEGEEGGQTPGIPNLMDTFTANLADTSDVPDEPNYQDTTLNTAADGSDLPVVDMSQAEEPEHNDYFSDGYTNEDLANW